MANDYIDRITMLFYDDEPLEMILLECLSKISIKRNRNHKIKELLLEHIEYKYPDIYKEAYNKYIKKSKPIIKEEPKEIIETNNNHSFNFK